MSDSKTNGGLGNRELSHMNKPFVAKIGWKILSESQCLLFHLLKAKYFPGTDFLYALKHFFFLSYIWESTL